MILDQVPFCYKEYPPVPEYQCVGHKMPIRWTMIAPGILIGIALIIILAVKIYEQTNM